MCLYLCARVLANTKWEVVYNQERKREQEEIDNNDVEKKKFSKYFSPLFLVLRSFVRSLYVYYIFFVVVVFSLLLLFLSFLFSFFRRFCRFFFLFLSLYIFFINSHPLALLCIFFCRRRRCFCCCCHSVLSLYLLYFLFTPTTTRKL